jgi:hypothetical protein
MSKSALAEKQQPQWTVYMEGASSSRERQGPSDLLEQSGRYLKFPYVMSGTQSHKRKLFYQLDPSPVSQGSTDFSVTWEHAAAIPLADWFKGFVKISGNKTPEWHHLGEFQLDLEYQSLPDIVGNSGGPSSFTFQRMPPLTEPSVSVETLQRRYKELNSKDYLGDLTEDEKSELAKLEQQLDDLDTNDANLTAFTAQIEQGYSKLRRGLSEVNRILDELLTD